MTIFFFYGIITGAFGGNMEELNKGMKYTKSFIEKRYITDPCDYKYDDVIQESPYRIFSKYENIERLVGFRFFDVNCIETGNIIDKSDRYNYSSWVWIGNKYSYHDIIEMYDNSKPNIDLVRYLNFHGFKDPSHLLSVMQQFDFENVCIDRFGDIHFLAGDNITYDDYLEQKGKGSK